MLFSSYIHGTIKHQKIDTIFAGSALKFDTFSW